MHVCQPWTNVPRYTTKPQTLRFSSHTSVLNFAGTALYIIPHMCAKPQTLRISSHTSLFWTFVEQLSILHHACVPTLNQCSKIHHKTSDPKIFISHICVELCQNSSPCSVFWMCQICKNLRARCLQSLQGVVPRFIPDKFLWPKFFFGINFYSQKRTQPPGVHGTQKNIQNQFWDHGREYLWIKFQWSRSCLSLDQPLLNLFLCCGQKTIIWTTVKP